MAEKHKILIGEQSVSTLGDNFIKALVESLGKSEASNKPIMTEKREVERSVNALLKTSVKTLVESLEETSTSKDMEAILATLKKIFDNIIQHPNDDKYRKIKKTNKRFSNEVWRYPAAVNFMKMTGWEEDGDYLTLRNELDAKAISELLG